MTRRMALAAMAAALAALGSVHAQALVSEFTPPAGHVYVVTLVDADPDHVDEAVALLLAHMRNAQGQPGCLQFDLVRQAPPTANHFALLQAWQDLPAQQAYAEAAGTKRFRAALLPISASPFDERLYWDATP
jgi:quinol monooxygenase YgiN